MFDQIVAQAPAFFTAFTFEFILEALLRTLAMTVLGCSVGLAAGFLIATVRFTRAPALAPLRVVLTVFVEVFRRIPFLVNLFIVMFALQGFGAEISLFTIATVSICIVATAFLSEVIRAGLESVPRQQIEAAQVMNFGYLRMLVSVLLPQSWKVILPPAFAFMVMFIKDTSLASQMGVVELTFTGKVLMNRGFSPFLVYGAVLAAYFVLSYPLSRLGAHLENRLATPRSRKSFKRVRAAASSTQHHSVG
ncbi:amino acid ABC transporter permease [Paraburkholderia caballeronis]|uniref:amino acid ABC transporter permease n=1 Tax=Paraburkholderia caballeronis TaxID=416943 RepID=UPI0010647F16|nr:amino acid ABC transporter permease [Paraburkholderia caballeronis]TDV15678.1 amino acid ABC transporter membrane protein 2 (PAAT family) [Paraburkholderia caballeronis]TDV17933.1 amino acid ABC transporter membrane protein 2 (PAAT family) [Paraburkholderia caballeronis]TDV26453.1 amino acid ABC transporter membrane protein 2 (PAAT family) [Paraburkholderia caballeronis]TDV33609.1 amino acid ABC transporter membrane protein 2 (PAAT family) [Paraburkholderia caballeronis]